VKIPLKQFSVSMLTTFGTPSAPGCKRKMAFNWLMGMKSPPTAAQARGTGFHDTIEKTVIADFDPTLPFAPPSDHRIYLDGVAPYLPKPGEHALVEHWMEMPTQFGIPFVGKIDLVRYQLEVARLIDWKTMGDARYMLTPAEVQKDVQTNVYGHYLFGEGLEEPLEGGLIYIEMPKTPPKKKAKVVPRLVPLTKKSTRAVWDSIQPVMADIIRVAELDSPQDVEPNTMICPKYGGCPFRGECGLPMFASLSSPKHTPAKKKENAMSFADRLKAKGQNGQNRQTQPPPPVVMSPPEVTKTAAPAVAPTTSVPKGSFTAKMQAKKAAQEAGQVETTQQPFSIIPPDAPPRDSGGADPLPEAEPQVALSDGEEAVVEAPRGRGRPKGSTKNGEVKVTNGKKSFTLYYDCMVTKGRGEVEPTHLEDFFGPVAVELDEVAASENLPSWWLLEYGPQKAALAVKIQEHIAKGLPNEMIVRTSSPVAREILPFLVPHATKIVSKF
jgi:hypothetical protein